MLKDRAANLDAASEIRAKAAKGAQLHQGEQVALEQYEKRVAELTPLIEESESKNTLLQQCKKHGFAETLLSGGERQAPAQGEESTGNRRMSLRTAMQFATPEQREQVNSFARYLGGDMTALADLTPSGDGGVFIPQFVAGVVARNYAGFTPVHDNCTVWPTADGVPTAFPVISDSEEAEILVPAAATGADATVSGDTPPTEITGPVMVAHKFSSKPVFLPRETITDSNLNVLEEVLNALIARILRTQNKKYTVGTGTGEPEGFTKNATYFTAAASVLDLDVALDLAYSVPALYRPRGIYMASDLTIKYLRKLKTGISGDKQSLWKDAFEEGNATLGTPPRLHGYSIIVNNDMDSVASNGTFAGVSPLAFGDFKKFVVRDAEQGSPFVYRYMVPAKDGNAVIAFQRSDSKLIVPEAIALLAPTSGS